MRLRARLLLLLLLRRRRLAASVGNAGNGLEHQRGAEGLMRREGVRVAEQPHATDLSVERREMSEFGSGWRWRHALPLGSAQLKALLWSAWSSPDPKPRVPSQPR